MVEVDKIRFTLRHNNNTSFSLSESNAQLILKLTKFNNGLLRPKKIDKFIQLQNPSFQGSPSSLWFKAYIFPV